MISAEVLKLGGTEAGRATLSGRNKEGLSNSRASRQCGSLSNPSWPLSKSCCRIIIRALGGHALASLLADEVPAYPKRVAKAASRPTARLLLNLRLEDTLLQSYSAEALLDVVTGRLKEAERTLKEDEEAQTRLRCHGAASHVPH